MSYDHWLTTDRAFEDWEDPAADREYEIADEPETWLTVCSVCNGDGGFDEPAAWTPAWYECRSCRGKGETEVERAPMTLDDLEELEAEGL